MAKGICASRVIKEGVLYRSARPGTYPRSEAAKEGEPERETVAEHRHNDSDDASPRDRERLQDELGIKTVMDLRTK